MFSYNFLGYHIDFLGHSERNKSSFHSTWWQFIRILFYQALQFNTSIAGLYTFTSASSTYTATFGCLYQTSFDPSNPSNNLIVYGDASGFQEQFEFTSTLQSATTYILVVTTSTYYNTGAYSAIVDGPGSIVMVPLSPVISKLIECVQFMRTSQTDNFLRCFISVILQHS